MLRELLFQHHQIQMIEQKNVLETTLHQWMKIGMPEEEHQIDDILVIGFKLV